ncbi:MAG: hypothetical protein WD926_00615 [Patescibacteria group bacterium]
MRTIVGTTIEVDPGGRVKIKDSELHLTGADGPRDPVELTDGCTLAYVQSDLLGPTILVSGKEGNPLCALSVDRPDTYYVEIVEDDDSGFTQVRVKIPTREPALA